MSMKPIKITDNGISGPALFEKQYLDLSGKLGLTFSRITFLNCGQIFGPEVKQSGGVALPAARKITFDHCRFVGCSPEIERFIELHPGNDDWKWNSCYFADLPNAIYSLCDGGLIGAERVTVRDCTFERIGKETGAKDAHAVGLQGGSFHKVVNNKITDAGTAICLWAPRDAKMTNAYVAKNKIRDCHARKIATGSGIEFSGDLGAAKGSRAGGICKDNDIAGCDGRGISSNWPDEIAGLSANRINDCAKGNLRITGL